MPSPKGICDCGAMGDVHTDVQTRPHTAWCAMEHFEMWKDADGVWNTPTHDPRCGKPRAPYMVGVPQAEADRYCWGHDTEDAIAEATADLCARLSAAEAERDHWRELAQNPQTITTAEFIRATRAFQDATAERPSDA